MSTRSMVITVVLSAVALACAPEPVQQLEGSGWRLLARESTGTYPDLGTYGTAIAMNEQAYSVLWGEIGLDGRRPYVDFSTSTVIWMGTTVGYDCRAPLLEDIKIDNDSVEPVFLTVQDDLHCGGAAPAFAYVVAIETELLPEVPFAIERQRATVVLDALDPDLEVPLCMESELVTC